MENKLKVYAVLIIYDAKIESTLVVFTVYMINLIVPSYLLSSFSLRLDFRIH